MRSITCTNNDGATMVFGLEAFSPFILASVDGLYSINNNVYISENTMTDGGTYLGSNAKVRNILITLIDKPNNRYNIENRDALYFLFKKGTKGTLVYKENDVERKIDYYVESVTRERDGARPIVISLLCPDPFFYGMSASEHGFSEWAPNLEFEHEFLEEGEEFGYLVATKIIEINNDFAYDGLGMTIRARCTGSATNFKITKVETQEFIAIGSAQKPFAMQYDDVLVITTHEGNKHVRLVRGGQTVEVNEYLTEDSRFFQIDKGLNTIGFSADSGEDSLEVSIEYTEKFEAT